MTASMFQGEGGYTSVVGERARGHMPQALKSGSEGPVLSELQNMQANERKQHEQAYIYENGHNDHGMGQ